MWKRIIHNRWSMRAALTMFALVVLVIFGGFFIFSRTQRPQTPGGKPIIAQHNPSADSASSDSDADGLKDWEEQIYGTNAHNPDTDSDGTHDGDEIALGRDPLKPTTSKDSAHPNDYLSHTDTSAASSQDDSDRPNLTQKIAEIFGQEYLLNFLQNPNASQDIDGIVDKMVQVALEQSSSSSLPPIAIRDITVLRNASKDAMKNYFYTLDNTLITALTSVPDKKNINDIITDIITNQEDDTALKALADRVVAYNKFLKDIKPVPVPEDFVTIHLAYLNTAVREREAIKKIEQIRNDALLAVVGIRELSQTMTQYDDLIKQFKQLGRDKGISSETP